MEVHEPNHQHSHDSSSEQPILQSDSNVLSSHPFGDGRRLTELPEYQELTTD